MRLYAQVGPGILWGLSVTERAPIPDRLGKDSDDFYADLMALHDGLTEPESIRLNARLLLLFANEIGDLTRLRELMDIARTSND